MSHVTDRVIGDVLEGLEHAGTRGQQHEQLPHTAGEILRMEVQLLAANALQGETHWIGCWFNLDRVTDVELDVTSVLCWGLSGLGGLKQASISSRSKSVVRWGSCSSSSMGMCSF